MQAQSAQQTTGRALWFVLAALALAVILVVTSPAQPAAASCGGTTPAGTEAQLNAAIAAYNAVTTAGCTFTIQLTADINLNASTTPINNNTSGVSLVIEGNGKTVNGGGTLSGVRPFALSSSNLRPVTFNQITITGGDVSPSSGSGGGIEVQGGHLTVTNSTITGNTAATGGGISICAICSLTLRNSTISGNTATSSYGGGIVTSGLATIDSSTIVGNRACSACGGALGATAGTATVTNSILANSTLIDGSGSPADCAFPFGSNTVTDGGYNLVKTTGSCNFGATGSIIGQDPSIGPLADNGGPTSTHALLDGSPAINNGNTALTTDQRGYGRPAPAGAADDIGAYEYDATPLAVALASFEVAAQADHMLVTWETVSELGNAGFNLYRTATADPPNAADLLAHVSSQGPGSAQGFFYSHQDYSVTAGETYWYWLEDVDFNGATTMHEPVSVVFVGPTAVRLNGLEAAADRPALAWLWLLAGLVAIVAIVGASRLRTRRGNA
ncbi:MAG: choice-of-anchor Q domain-containing protein [Caldilineales bacterium]